MMHAVEKQIISDERQLLPEHDVSDLIGLRAIVEGAAVQVTDAEGEVSVEVPDITTLSATIAMARCLSPVRLRGHELRAMRRIARMTAVDMAERMGEKTSPETLSRWENEKQPIGGYAEKVFRLVICDVLSKRAPGIAYSDGAIARLTVVDPWRADPDYVVPPIVVNRVKMRAENNSIVNAWANAA